MLATGLLFAVLAIVGIVAVLAAPGLVPGDAADSSLRLTGLIWAIVFGGLAPVFLYIGWPSGEGGARGMKKAKATILGISRVPGDVTGYRLVELQLDVRPKGQMPYPVTRKFVANRFRDLEPGQVIDVRVDPTDPQRIELA
jgi:hypothetical protein